MKTLMESIRDRKNFGGNIKYNPSNLKTGYIIRYKKSGYLAMYFDFNTVKMFVSNDIIIDQVHHGGGFFSSDSSKILNWMPLCDYNESLRCINFPDYDIVEIYPVISTPKLTTQKQLEQIVRNIEPIKINQK